MRPVIYLGKKQKLKKGIASLLMIMLISEILWPIQAFALTSGPSQPEVQSFEPVGTTDMVDLFSGDFVYNIPLLDVGGYPVNLSYHGPGDMEQEASWVGLGWNINPGVINRSVRGIPDDFNGEVIEKKINIKPERNLRVSLGAGAEIVGSGEPYRLGLGGDIALNVSNYKGVSADLSLSISAADGLPGTNYLMRGSAGINLGVNSQNGADVDYNAGLSFASARTLGMDMASGLGLSVNHGYNTRSGLKDINFSVTGSVKNLQATLNANVPISLRNYVPVITNSSSMATYRGHLKLGGEFKWGFGYAKIGGMLSELKYAANGNRKSYGYLFLQNASVSSITDFTRDKDGVFNETMNFLPPASLTYDLFSVTGQGTGGSFRPFRNDYGSVFDPLTESEGRELSISFEAGVFPDIFGLGLDLSKSSTMMSSGPWEKYRKHFSKNKKGSVYENVYYKKAGEITRTYDPLGSAPVDGKASTGIGAKKPSVTDKRQPRGTLMNYFTAAEAAIPGVATSMKIRSYTSSNGFAAGAATPYVEYDRVAGGRRAHHISELTQTEKDGTRYVYSIPAMNHHQTEMTFAIAPSSTSDGLVSYSPADASAANSHGRDNFFTSSTTPAYAHSYLLTSVLSADYIDVTGNGPTDDDYGNYTKFNYTLKNAAYKWKAPYGSGLAQYNPAFKSDPQDDRASVVRGSREQWYLHSIETKNDIAEFYVSPRLDGKGEDTAADLSFRLDSIRLYNKQDRFINGAAAVPVKTVIFAYSYELCPNTPNSTAPGRGKLTLKKVYFRYGNSDRGMLSPYSFVYGANYNYAYANKNRWGGYKPQAAGLPNADFPFVNQNDPANDAYASAWALEQVHLPSGGRIDVSYESDDYAYVQDKLAMEMFMLKGLGASPAFQSSNQLFVSKKSPNSYFYFKREKDRENPALSARDNYLKESDILYYNFDIKLVNNKYENIKGFANVLEVGYCPDNIHGYIRTETVEPLKSKSKLPHPSYTAINFSRYYLPHIIYPGSDPEVSGIGNILAGLKAGFMELINIFKNPVDQLADKSVGKDLRLASSYIRLNTPDRMKKGGGLRVKSLTFNDNWASLSSGASSSAVYGKEYSYTTTTDDGTVISSGVASYEPLIGGDENPFREPDKYIAQRGSKFPPNEPIGLYNEMPLGESLYPSPHVGYSKVTVSSIHKDYALSAQAQDIYEYYTARDYPIQVRHTVINKDAPKPTISFRKQFQKYEGSQGYTFIFNDMHGKSKRTETRILKPGSEAYDVVTYNDYKYFGTVGDLSNEVPVVAYDEDDLSMKYSRKTMGVEDDMTIDTRQKLEHTRNSTMYINLNVSTIPIPPFVLPLPLMYPYIYNAENEFYSVVATKVVQKYGILESVKSFNEGAVTIVRNEAFDPVTGEAIITSVNNEYNDLEYRVNYPAYWAYESMGGGYENISYTNHYNHIRIENYKGKLPGSLEKNLKIGDELLMSYNQGGVRKTNNVWVTGIEHGLRQQIYSRFCEECGDTIVGNNSLPVFNDTEYGIIFSECATGTAFYDNIKGQGTYILQPRFKHSWPANDSITDVSVTVVRSGAKNQLTDQVQSYVGMSTPFDGEGRLKDKLDRLISISATLFSDTIYSSLPQFDSLLNPSTWDSLNVYAAGSRGIKKVSEEYAYMTRRGYRNYARADGLFAATSLWTFSGSRFAYRYCLDPVTKAGYRYRSVLTSDIAEAIGYNFLYPSPAADAGWVSVRTVNKLSPWGFEIENTDAVGNVTSATYAYNNLIPVATGYNNRAQEMLHEGFEDYRMLSAAGARNRFYFSPFKQLFGRVAHSSLYDWFSLSGTSGLKLTTAVRHTGLYSLEMPASHVNVNIPLTDAVSISRKGMKPFGMVRGKAYIISFWMRDKSTSATAGSYSLPSGYAAKSGIIEGWQLVEREVTAPTSGTVFTFQLPGNKYIDDIRIMPSDANTRAFVYNPVSGRLVAGLDENNFAVFYEYDQDGTLIRTKKETEKGIMTVTESRSSKAKAQ